MTHSIKTFIRAVCVLLSTPALAAPNAQSTASVSADLSPAPRKWTEGPALFGKTGAGFGLLSSDAYSNSPSGPAALLGVALSWKTQSWVFDGGLGWLYTNASGTAASGVSADIKTRSGLGELGARYLLSPHWQIGPVANLAFGTDTRPGPTIAGSTTSPFLGVKGVYETDLGARTVLRGFLQGSTRVASEGNVLLALAGVELGLPFTGGSSSTTSAMVAKAEPAPAPSEEQQYPSYAYSSAEYRNVEFVRELRLSLDPQKIFFRTNSSELKPKVAQALKSAGTYLKDHSKDWASVEISGHADRRGKAEYNLKLSRKRAESVRQVLLYPGADPKRIRLRAFGFSKPIDSRNTPSAWALNRRVDLLFRDVRKPEGLIRSLEPLMSQRPGDGPVAAASKATKPAAMKPAEAKSKPKSKKKVPVLTREKTSKLRASR